MEIETKGETEILLSCSNERDSISFGRGENDFTVMASLKAPFFEDSSRAPIDLVTVIDRSGSMAGDKITLVKETLNFVVSQLKYKDRLSIVLYDDVIEKRLPLTYMDAPGKEHASRVIRDITSRGSTDLCGGLLEGIQVILQRTDVRNDVSSVLLFTDGLANIGIQDTKAIIAEMAKKAESPGVTSGLTPGEAPTEGSVGIAAEVLGEHPLPCSVHTFGFGSDHDANMLKAISDKGRGIYFFIENKDTIADAFADCLGGLLSVVAQNIVLELQGQNGITINSVKTAYKFKIDAGKFTINLGDIQSEEERDILCSITVPILPEPTQQVLIDAKVTYFNVITSKQEERTAIDVLERPVDDTSAIVNYKVDRQKNRIITASAISEAKTKGDAGDYAGARSIIETAIATLKSSISANDDFVISLLGDLSTSLAGLRDPNTYNRTGGHTMTSCSSSHYQQRSTISTTTYVTSARVTMRSKLDQ